jgi:hypothetical protein
VHMVADGLREAKDMVAWTARRAAQHWTAAPFGPKDTKARDGVHRKAHREGGCHWLRDADRLEGPLWACEVCGRWSKLPLSKRRKLGACPGRVEAVQAARSQGHSMASWAILSGQWAGRTLHGCTKCAATAMAHFVHLKHKCPGRPRGHQVWVGRQLQEGRHPNGKDLVAMLPRRRAEHGQVPPKQEGEPPAPRTTGQGKPVQDRPQVGSGPCPTGVASRAPGWTMAPAAGHVWQDPFGPDAPDCSEDEQAFCSEPTGACGGAWAEPPLWDG